jgi:hypothetical protein
VSSAALEEKPLARPRGFSFSFRKNSAFKILSIVEFIVGK